MVAITGHAEIDNSSLSSPGFCPHVRTFGLVYTLPKEVNDTLDLTVKGMLREKLLNAKLDDEAHGTIFRTSPSCISTTPTRRRPRRC